MSKKTEVEAAEKAAPEVIDQSRPVSEALAKDEAASEAVVKSPGTRVSLGAIEDHIGNVAFMSVAGFAEFANGGKDIDAGIAPSMQATTICVITTKNGFSVVGLAAPVDPLNFDRELGRKFAYEDAVRKLWPILGYAKRVELQAR